MKNNIQTSKEKVKLEGWGTIHIRDKDSLLYREKIDELSNVASQNNCSNRVKEISEMLSDKSTWGEIIENYVANNNQVISKEKQFINIMDINKLLELIEQSDTYNIQCFYSALYNFYFVANIYDFYADDILI